MDIRTKCVARSIRDTRQVSFNIKDVKGRVVGTEIELCEERFEEMSPDEVAARRGWSTVQPGCYFVLRVHATRDGRWYGAIQDPRYFATAEQREEAIAKYLETARKRAHWAFGGSQS